MKIVPLIQACVLILAVNVLHGDDDVTAEFAENTLKREGIDLSDENLVKIVKQKEESFAQISAIQILATRGVKYRVVVEEAMHHNKSVFDRLAAAKAVGRWDSESAKTALRNELAKDANKAYQFRIAKDLAELGDSASIPILKKHLNETTNAVRNLDIAKQLARLGDPDSVSIFTKYIQDKDSWVRTRAIMAAPAFINVYSNVVNDLINLLPSAIELSSKGTEAEIRDAETEILFLRSSLLQIRDSNCIASLTQLTIDAPPFAKRVLNGLVEGLKSENASIGSSTRPRKLTEEECLGNYGIKTNTTTLLNAFKASSNSYVRTIVIRILAKDKSQPATFFKQIAENDNSLDVRLEALKAFGTNDVEYSKSVLKKAMNDASEHVTGEAGFQMAVMLTRLNDPSGTIYVKRQLKSKDSWTRLMAIGVAPVFVQYDTNIINDVVSCVDPLVRKMEGGAKISELWMEVETLRTTLREMKYTNSIPELDSFSINGKPVSAPVRNEPALGTTEQTHANH